MEDDDTVRSLVIQLLEMNGHNVWGFDDAAPALDTVNFEDVDLVVTDLSMRTPGEKAIQEIHACREELPILVITGHADDDRSRHVESIGARRVMHKPFRATELMDSVASLLAD